MFFTVEGHSIYIRNLPLNVTVAQLEAEFAKFGPIKPNGVQVRGNKVGQTVGFYYIILFAKFILKLISSVIAILHMQFFLHFRGHFESIVQFILTP